MTSSGPSPARVRVLSSNSLVGELLETFLTTEYSGTLPVTVVLDAPWGYAHEAFASSTFADMNADGVATVLASDNPCGEYWDDLWDLGSDVLIAKQLSSGELVSILTQVEAGSRAKLTPFYETPLTKTERKILRLCATQRNLKQVAELAQVGSGTLKNHLSSIYSKLGLRGLVDLNLYYFGGRVQDCVWEGFSCWRCCLPEGRTGTLSRSRLQNVRWNSASGSFWG